MYFYGEIRKKYPRIITKHSSLTSPLFTLKASRNSSSLPMQICNYTKINIYSESSASEIQHHYTCICIIIATDQRGYSHALSGLRCTCTNLLPSNKGGWSGGAKVLCILHHWGVQLILAYSWARPAILVVGKGRGGMFLFLLFLHFLSCSSFFPVPLFHLLYSLFYLSSPFLWETTQNDPQGLTCR